MERPAIDVWANFLANEKLVPERIDDYWKMKLVQLCEALAKIQRPDIRSHKHKLKSRNLVCLTAMELGIDLPDVRHKVTRKRLIGRGLLDAWNIAYREKYGDNFGTECVKEAKRRDIKTRLSKEDL